MSWAIGYDTYWGRDIGYGVPAVCDHPECNEEIDRGLAYVCGGEPYGGEDGCGLYFCLNHSLDPCGHVFKDAPGYHPSDDTEEWITHKLTHSSWQRWRDDNPAWVSEHGGDA